MPDSSFPNPGPSYSIVEKLSSGRHKTAYRATASSRATDVALLYAKNEGEGDLEALRDDMYALMRIKKNHPGFRHVAELISLEHGEDGRPFIVEEFLDSPLIQLSPLDDIRRVCEIGRDLSIGLACIQAAGLAHHDIKLDNCGIDRHGNAKLFDLGSLTSDFCSIRGNIYTRPPEIILGKDSSVSFDEYWKESDVWSLGATIFALRTGSYPLITGSEFEYREGIGKGDNGKTDAENDILKGEFEGDIVRKLGADGLEGQIYLRIEQNFSGGSAEIMKAMLSFDPERRPTTEICNERWSEVCVERAGFRNIYNDRSRNKLELLEMMIASACQADMHLTYSQCERVISDLEGMFLQEKSENEKSKLKELIERAKSLKIEAGKKRAPAFADA